jgi:hypothetical protein
MYVNVDVDVDVDEILSNLDDDELIEELERRGKDFNTQFIDGDVAREMLVKIWELRHLGKDYDKEVDALLYYILGKAI